MIEAAPASVGAFSFERPANRSHHNARRKAAPVANTALREPQKQWRRLRTVDSCGWAGFAAERSSG